MTHVTCRILLIGFGAAGQAFVRLLRSKSADLLRNHAVRFDIACVYTRSKGFAASQQPSKYLEYDWLLEEYQRDDYLQCADQSLPTMQVLRQKYGIDIVIETISANYNTAEPALSLAEEALKQGIHLVTANKAVVVHGYRDRLKTWGSERAIPNGTGLPLFLFESVVMDGVPIFNLAKYSLGGARITGFRGVLNSTCNLILTQMEQTRCSLEEALSECQQLGIAETDPTGDIDGYDSMFKTCALATVLLEPDPQSRGSSAQLMEAVSNQITQFNSTEKPEVKGDYGASIRQVTHQQIDDCMAQRNTRLKVVCEAFLVASSSGTASTRNHCAPAALDISVKLIEVAPDSVFYNLTGASSAIEIYSQELAPICITSTNPTTTDTAFGLLSDCLEVMRLCRTTLCEH